MGNLIKMFFFSYISTNLGNIFYKELGYVEVWPVGVGLGVIEGGLVQHQVQLLTVPVHNRNGISSVSTRSMVTLTTTLNFNIPKRTMKDNLTM